MTKIALRGIRFHSFHGYYAEERSVGNDYEIDIEVELVIDPEELADDLSNTINYEQIYQICKDEMNKPCHLIETVTHNILDRLKRDLDENAHYRICLHKLHPLLGGLVDRASIEVEG